MHNIPQNTFANGTTNLTKRLRVTVMDYDFPVEFRFEWRAPRCQAKRNRLVKVKII